MTIPKPNLLQVSLANAIILSALLTLFLSVNSTAITDLAQVLGLALASQFLRFLFSRSLPSRKPFITLFLGGIASSSNIYLFWFFSFLLNYLGIPNFNDGNFLEVQGNLFGVLIAPIAMSLLSFWVIIICIISYGVSDALLKRIQDVFLTIPTTTHLHIKDNAPLVKAFKKVWWSSKHVQNRMVSYSYAKPGEIYGDFSPFSLNLDRSITSPLEVRGIEENPGSLKITSSIHLGRVGLSLIPMAMVAGFFTYTSVQTGELWHLGPAIAIVLLGLLAICLMLFSWKRSLDQLVKAVYKKALEG